MGNHDLPQQLAVHHAAGRIRGECVLYNTVGDISSLHSFDCTSGEMGKELFLKLNLVSAEQEAGGKGGGRPHFDGANFGVSERERERVGATLVRNIPLRSVFKLQPKRKPLGELLISAGL